MLTNLVLAINKLSFPGLGIGEFSVNETAFTLFGHDVAWYGVIVTFAILAVCAYVYKRAKSVGFVLDDILDYFIFSILFGILGARLYYVIFYGLDRYIVTDGGFFSNLKNSFINIIGIWNGGIAIYGGIIAIVITVIVVSRRKGVPPAAMLDFGGHGAMLGQAIGRWGNFVNAEAYGVETELFTRMGITNSLGMTRYYHPTFLYESLWNVTGFILINILFRRRKYNGQVFLAYCAWYGLGRMFIEGLRTDSLYIGSTGIRVSQLLGFLLFALGTVALVVIGKRKREVTHAEFEAGLKESLKARALYLSEKQNKASLKAEDAEEAAGEENENGDETE